MPGNLFDSIDGAVTGSAGARPAASGAPMGSGAAAARDAATATTGGAATARGAAAFEEGPWAARSPFRPEDGRDLMLVPRVRGDWAADPAAREALERIAADPAVAEIVEHARGVDVRLDDEWVEARGEQLESGPAPEENADLVAGARYAVYFWGANTTKALHIGHLRNLALGNALAAALRTGGAKVESRSLICDVGRSMGEAMAGVVASGRADDIDFAGESGEKSDHFVGLCYADYVTAGRTLGDDGAEDSVARESALYDDKADELMMRVLSGDQRALELWSKTRSWVISGQRKTLARLGVPFDKVIFESDYLPEVAELANLGLREGTLRRREDGMVIYPTAREELEEMPLVRADGLPTQHMRALAYWSAAGELDDLTSLQVCGTEWVAHVTCRRQLLDALAAARPNGHPNPVVNGNGRGGPPSHDVFHGMVARQKRAITSSAEGALLIDDLVEWLEERLAADPALAAVRASHPQPDRVAARIALAYFLLQTTTKRIEFEPELLLEPERSLGWDLVVAQAHRAGALVGAGAGGPSGIGSASGAIDPDYRFAVVQSELFRRHLRSAVAGLDPVPLARWLSHFARWYAAGERSPRVEAVARTVLDEGVRGLGLEVA
jgi:arginyl-tRNA synthetase